MTTLILRTTARVVLPLVLVYSAALFFQGHNQPGGGFIAGVLTAAGIALMYMAYDVDYFEKTTLGGGEGEHHFRSTVVGFYRHASAAGLLIAVAGGIAAVLLGYPFLSQSYVESSLPLFGDVEVASAIVFDFGVYVVVVGALLTIVSLMGGEYE